MRVTNKLLSVFLLTAAVLIALLAGSCLLGDDIDSLREKALMSGMPQGVYVPGLTLEEKFEWLKDNAEDSTAYVMEVKSGESLSPKSLIAGGEYLPMDAENITINLWGGKAERIINLDGRGFIFYIGSGITLALMNNITLVGQENNNNPLINVSIDGALIMNKGSKISGNHNIGNNGGGVYIDNGTFTMNGGTISGNTASSGGGVYIDNGTFIMNGGTISGNTASVGGTGIGSESGGGVYLNFIDTDCFFNKTGGTIYGGSAGANSNIAHNDSLSHAIHLRWMEHTGVSDYFRSDNVNDNISFNGNTGILSGTWYK